MVVVRFVRSTVFPFFRSCHSSLYNLSSMCWLAALRGVRGAFGVEGSWLLQLQANLVALRVLRRFRTGCRLEVGGSACSLCARSPGCGCFCLRLDFHVTVSVRGGQGSQPGFLVLAFSARTLPSSGVPARRVQARDFCVGMLPLVCRALGRRGFFVRSTVVAFWGAAFLSARIPSSLSCLRFVGFQHFGGMLLAVRLEVRVFLRMRLICVVICWGRARRAPRSGPSRPQFSYDDRWFLRRY